PDTTVAGEQVRSVTVTGGRIVTEAVALLPLSDAVMVATWLEVTVPALAVNTAVEVFSATVTEAGTVSAALLSVMVTTAPPVGAGWVKVRVQEVLLPELTVVGLHCTVVILD